MAAGFLCAKITQEVEAESKAFEEYTDWCTEMTRKKGFEIKTGTTNKAKLEARISKKAGDAEALISKTEELPGSIATGERIFLMPLRFAKKKKQQTLLELKPNW